MIGYIWDGSGRSRILRPPKVNMNLSTTGAADAAAAKANLDAMPAGQKACIFQSNIDLGSFNKTNVADLFENGPYSTDINTYFTDFGNKLATDGTDLDFVILDEELGHMGQSYILSGLDGLSTPTRVGQVDLIWNAPASLANVPKWVQDIVAAAGGTTAFATNSNNSAYQYSWEQWGRWMREEHFRKFIRGPIESALGHAIKMTNYRTYIPSFTIWNRFNTPKIRTTPSNECAPVMYHYDSAGTDNRYGSISKHIHWNTFIDQINAIASCTNVVGSTCIPWIGFRGYKGGAASDADNYFHKEHEWAWDRALIAMKVCGIPEVAVFGTTTAPETEAQRDTLNDYMIFLDTIQQEYYDKVAIPLDAESVTVGSHTWTYEEYQAEAL